MSEQETVHKFKVGDYVRALPSSNRYAIKSISEMNLGRVTWLHPPYRIGGDIDVKVISHKENYRIGEIYNVDSEDFELVDPAEAEAVLNDKQKEKTMLNKEKLEKINKLVRELEDIDYSLNIQTPKNVFANGVEVSLDDLKPIFEKKRFKVIDELKALGYEDKGDVG